MRFHSIFSSTWFFFFFLFGTKHGLKNQQLHPFFRMPHESRSSATKHLVWTLQPPLPGSPPSLLMLHPIWTDYSTGISLKGLQVLFSRAVHSMGTFPPLLRGEIKLSWRAGSGTSRVAASSLAWFFVFLEVLGARVVEKLSVVAMNMWNVYWKISLWIFNHGLCCYWIR